MFSPVLTLFCNNLAKTHTNVIAVKRGFLRNIAA
jgi:hypothetical protein